MHNKTFLLMTIKLQNIAKLMNSQNSWMLTPQITSHKVHHKHYQKLYCLNLSKQREFEYKSQQKKFTIPFDFTDTNKKISHHV